MGEEGMKNYAPVVAEYIRWRGYRSRKATHRAEKLPQTLKRFEAQPPIFPRRAVLLPKKPVKMGRPCQPLEKATPEIECPPWASNRAACRRRQSVIFPGRSCR
jgi:hypothetical protein